MRNEPLKKPEWIKFAEAELGVQTSAAGSSNPQITQYHAGTNIEGYDDKAAWCSSFINWVFEKTGIEGTGSALARSWLAWGREIAQPRYGCVVVLARENPSGWQGHVGFFLRVEGEQIYLLGGNQLDKVCEHHYPISSVLGFRWPAN